MKDQRSVSIDGDVEQRTTISIKRPRSLSSKIAGLFAMAVALLFIATAFSPMASAYGVDLVAKDASLKDVKIDVLKLDPVDITNRATSGEPLSLWVNGSSVSFTLKEGTLLADNFRVMLPDGTSLGRSDGITIPRFFSGASPEGVTIYLTVAGEWMRFSVQTNDSSYSIDAYDGTGASGYYAAYLSGPSPASAADVVDDKEPTVRESMYRVAEPLDNTTASSASEATAPTSIGTQNLEASVNSGTEQVLTNDMSLMSGYANEHSSVLVDIFLVADYAYTSIYSNWADRIYSEIWNVHGHYESQAGVSFNVVGLAQLDQNTCTSSDAYTLWTEFKSYLNNLVAYPTSSDWDVAHLFSGQTLNPGDGNYATYSSGAGIAILRNDQTTFKGYGCSVSQQTYAGTNENEWLLGHCIGLSLNADHACAGSSSDWMWSTWNAQSTLHMNSNEVNRIQTFARQVCDRSKLINFGGSEHWNGLYVTNMVMITTDVPTVGNSVTFGFTVYNTGNAITLPVLCVGGRDANGDVKNFGQRTNVLIPGRAFGVDGIYDFWNTSLAGFDSGGTWTLFASAYYNGQYSPYEWLSLHPTVYYCLNSWHRTSTPPEFSTNDLFHQWGIYATSLYVGPGSEIMVSFTLFSKAGGTGYTNYEWIFVEARDPNNVVRDFGGVSNVMLTNGGYNALLGGGLHEKVTTTLTDSTGIWQLSPCYKLAGMGWGPWMAPRCVSVGFFILSWDDMGDGLISLNDWGAEYHMMLSTADGGNSLFYLGFHVYNFHEIETAYGCPTVVLEVATLYEDRMNTTTDYRYSKHNPIISIKINIEKTIVSDNGVTYGSSGTLNDSAIFWRIGSDYNKYAGGTNLHYPSQRLEETGVMGDTALAVLSMMSEGVGLITGITEVLSGMAQMLGRVQLQDTKEVNFDEQSTAWVRWDADRLLPNSAATGPDNSASYNYVDLPLGHTGDTYCYRMNAEVTYAKAIGFSWDIGYYVSDEETVLTPYIYLAVV